MFAIQIRLSFPFPSFFFLPLINYLQKSGEEKKNQKKNVYGPGY